MTQELIRKELARAEEFYTKWMDEGHYDRANLALRAIDKLREALIEAICSEDPYTTAADIRYFESEEGETDCVTGCDPAEYEDEDWSDQSAHSYTL